MGFNGLFDLPQLFMILCIMSAFVFRQMIRVQFGYSLVFLSIYIQTALTLKIVYLIAIQIDFVDDYIKENFETNFYIKWLRIVFGQHSNIKEVEDQNTSRIAYLICLFICIYSCQVWRQCKWIEFRDKTSAIKKLKGADFLTKVSFYFNHRDEIYTEKDKLDQIIKSKKKLKKLLASKHRDDHNKVQ